ncbi:DUF72 domain-containing protein [soil metagenome]
MEWRIGCSGFSYKDWKGSFYPEKLAQSKWFGYYSERFKTLELNVTFYRFPQVRFLQNWYDKSPSDFSFAVKAPRLISHYKKFNDCEKFLSDFYGTCKEGLKEKLGPVLFQLPPQIVYDEAFLEKMIQQLNPDFANVVEFRHASWWQQKVYYALSKQNITFCSISHPTLPDDVIINTSLVYYRFHGVPKLYYSQYTENKLISIADAIIQSKKVKTAFIYFNNTATMAALNNAASLKTYLNISR